MRLIPDGKYGLLTAAIVWVLIVYLTVPEGFDYSFKDEISTGSALTKLIWIALLAFSLTLILWRGSLAMVMLRWINPWLLVFIALAAFSVIWSIEPSFTLKRVVRLLTFVTVALAFSLVGWHDRRFQNMLRPLVTLLMLGSLIFGVLEPTLAIEQSEQLELVGAWHGLTMQKNSLGALAGIGAILWLHARLAGEVTLLRALLGGLLCGACLFLSRSSTSLMATLFALAFMLMVLRSSAALRPLMPYLVTLFVAVLLLYSLAVLRLVPGLDFVLTPITSITGKDLSFSGRTAIWDIINEHIAQHPLLGGGYGAYWTGNVPESPSYEFVTRINFYPTQSHNGYLDVINDLGVPGALCLFGFLVVYVRQALALMRVNLIQSALYLGLLFQQLVGNLSEARWFNTLSVDFAIMTVASVAMSRILLNHRLQALGTVPGASARAK
jgi:exopolysaccharide production protein ExoQ